MSEEKKVKIEKLEEAVIGWVKDAYFPNKRGGLTYLGNVILINNQMIALGGYSNEELTKLHEVVVKAVEYERVTRKSKLQTKS